MRAGGDVEEDHFVRALLVVAQGQLDWIANIAQLAFLGLAKLNAARDLSIVNVQARDNPFCNHACIESISKNGSKQVNRGMIVGLHFAKSVGALYILFAFKIENAKGCARSPFGNV